MHIVRDLIFYDRKNQPDLTSDLQVGSRAGVAGRARECRCRSLMSRAHLPLNFHGMTCERELRNRKADNRYLLEEINCNHGFCSCERNDI